MILTFPSIHLSKKAQIRKKSIPIYLLKAVVGWLQPADVVIVRTRIQVKPQEVDNLLPLQRLGRLPTCCSTNPNFSNIAQSRKLGTA